MDRLLPEAPPPDDDWVKVELYRWQYGELPQSGYTTDTAPKKLDIPKAIEAMSKGIEEGCRNKNAPMTTPMNVCLTLEYCARQIRRQLLAKGK